MDNEQVRVRIAPSPTGALHLGLARTALYNWLFARGHNGVFILRIDDTDENRNQPEMLAPILRGLRWLGLDWDEGPDKGGPHAPYFQSERRELYQQAVDRLIAGGAAYKDYATPEEIAAEREQARAEGRTFRYSRRWMAETAADCARFEAEGRRPVVRLKMPDAGTLVVDDLIRGRVEFDLGLEQDHVIVRQDGSFLYHLTSAVDDALMGITHIIRAEEHLSNTPRQIFILQSLGYPLPKFAHLPYVAEPGSRNKLSKRKLKEYLKKPDFAELLARGEKIARRLGLDTSPELFNPVVIDFYQQTGFLAEALVNYLALLGWSYDDRTEFFTVAELVRLFSLERVVRSPASFDPNRLMAFQVHYLMALPVQERTGLVLPYLIRAGLISEPVMPEVREKVARIVEAAGDRIKVAGDILDYDYFFLPDGAMVYEERAVRKWLGDEGRRLLVRVREVLAGAEPFEPERLMRVLEDFARRENVKGMAVSQALRVAVTGRDYGFAIGDVLSICGRERVLARIDRVLGGVHF